MKYLSLLTFFIFTACSSVTLNLSKYQDYTVKAGAHNFTPDPPQLPLSAKSFNGACTFDASCWYNDLSDDNFDWNKLTGFYRWSDYKKNENSFMLAWRPSPVKNWFELTLYENYPSETGKNHPLEPAQITVQAGEEFTFDFLFENGKYKLVINNRIVGAQRNPINFALMGWVSGWWGGNRTAPRPAKYRLWISEKK
jgi:hypothetical protein